jgi:hypothetical protein
MSASFTPQPWRSACGELETAGTLIMDGRSKLVGLSKPWLGSGAWKGTFCTLPVAFPLNQHDAMKEQRWGLPLHAMGHWVPPEYFKFLPRLGAFFCVSVNS